jgi:hypothetical protein
MYFNIKRWQLVILWLAGLFWVMVESDSYYSNSFITAGIPFLLVVYTIGWIGNRNSQSKE